MHSKAIACALLLTAGASAAFAAEDPAAAALQRLLDWFIKSRKLVSFIPPAAPPAAR